MNVLDYLFPKICVKCQGEGVWFCDACLASETMSPLFTCAECRKPTIDGRYCEQHQAGSAAKGLITVYPFHQGPIRDALHSLKYEGIIELAQPLGRMLALYLRHYAWSRNSLIVPVPLHPRRLRQRGYNQAELLAQQLDSVDLSVMKRIHYRCPQATLAHEKRQANVQEAFTVELNSLAKLKGRTVVVVDDVATTGSTINEIARVLLANGAGTVWGAVIAKG